MGTATAEFIKNVKPSEKVDYLRGYSLYKFYSYDNGNFYYTFLVNDPRYLKAY